MDRKIVNCHTFQHSRKNAKQLKYQRAITFHNTIIQWNSIIKSQNLSVIYNKIIKPLTGFYYFISWSICRFSSNTSGTLLGSCFSSLRASCPHAAAISSPIVCRIVEGTHAFSRTCWNFFMIIIEVGLCPTPIIPSPGLYGIKFTCANRPLRRSASSCIYSSLSVTPDIMIYS